MASLLYMFLVVFHFWVQFVWCFCSTHTDRIVQRQNEYVGLEFNYYY